MIRRVFEKEWVYEQLPPRLDCQPESLGSTTALFILMNVRIGSDR